MGIFYNLRLAAGTVRLRRQRAELRRVAVSFCLDNVQRVGILWDGSYEHDFQHISALKRQLTDSGRSVEVIVWIPGKSVPDKLTGLSYLKFLRRSDLKWNLFPVSDDVQRFMNTSYDLLIDINPAALFQLQVIAGLSPSPMKVGPDLSANPESAPYDLMIKAPGQFSTALFLENVMHYLALIKPPVTG